MIYECVQRRILLNSQRSFHSSAAASLFRVSREGMDTLWRDVRTASEEAGPVCDPDGEATSTASVSAITLVIRQTFLASKSRPICRGVIKDAKAVRVSFDLSDCADYVRYAAKMRDAALARWGQEEGATGSAASDAQAVGMLIPLPSL